MSVWVIAGIAAVVFLIIINIRMRRGSQEVPKSQRVVKHIVGWFFILAVIVGVISFFVTHAVNVPPSIDKAPWVVQTFSYDSRVSANGTVYQAALPSRFYYAEQVRVTDNATDILDYWTFDGKHYHYVAGEMSFPVSLYGTNGVKVIKR